MDFFVLPVTLVIGWIGLHEILFAVMRLGVSKAIVKWLGLVYVSSQHNYILTETV